MGKLLFFLLLAVLVYRLVHGGRRAQPPRPRPPGSETMVACAHCGLHVPRGESLERNGRHYCCWEHLKLDAGA